MVTPSPTNRPPLPPRLVRDTRWTLVLLGATMITWLFGVPVVLLALVTGPAAAAFAIAGLIHSRGVRGIQATLVWLWIAIGVGGLSTLTAGGVLVLREPLAQLTTCNAQAITETAKRQCMLDYERAYRDLLARYGVTTQP